MKKYIILAIAALVCSNVEAFFVPIKVSLDGQDRTALENAEKSFNDAADSLRALAQQIESSKISKALTQGGVVLISTATAILSAYSVFLRAYP